MKKLLLLIGFVVVLMTLFFYVYRPASLTYVADNTVPLPEEKAILLYPESGDVSFKLKSDDQFIIATTSPTEIPNGSIIHTDTGRASVLLPDNSSITLAENTEITVNYSPSKVSMYQTFGTTYHRVEKLITGASYQVQTAGTLAAVRGTKFVVSYDKKIKKTKVAVTESKVEVTTITKATSTVSDHQEEVFMVETGKTVTVDTEHRVKNKEGKLTAITEKNISEDKEIDIVVKREKKGDDDLEIIKKESKEKKFNKREERKEIKRVIFKDNGKKEDRREKREDNSVVKNEIKTDTKVESGDMEIKVNTATTLVTQPKTQVVVMDEEKFFNQFEPLFIKYFYLDETDSLCLLDETVDEKVKIVHEFASKNGYPFTKETLPLYARAIKDYCANKDVSVKVKLNARFDDEYPF